METHIALILGSNTEVLIADKSLHTLRSLLAILAQMGQSDIALVVGCSTDILNALQAVRTVTADVASLSKLSYRSVAGDLVDNTVANAVTVLVRLAVSTVLALGSQLGRGGDSKTSEDGGEYN